MRAETNSIRKYQLQMVEYSSDFTSVQLSIDRLLFPKENDFEYIYAINDLLDYVLDLKAGESMYFQCNRDNSESKGIILRIV